MPRGASSAGVKNTEQNSTIAMIVVRNDFIVFEIRCLTCVTLFCRPAMLQDLGEIVSPFRILSVHLAGALDSTRQVKSLKFTLSANYPGGFRLADRHRRGHCEDVPEQPIFDCLPFHHAVLVTIVIPFSMSRFTVHACPSSLSLMRR